MSEKCQHRTFTENAAHPSHFNGARHPSAPDICFAAVEAKFRPKRFYGTAVSVVKNLGRSWLVKEYWVALRGGPRPRSVRSRWRAMISKSQRATFVTGGNNSIRHFPCGTTYFSTSS